MPAATAIRPELGFRPLEGRFLVREHVRELHKGDTFAVGLAEGTGGQSEDPLSTVTVCLNPVQLSIPGYNYHIKGKVATSLKRQLAKTCLWDSNDNLKFRQLKAVEVYIYLIRDLILEQTSLFNEGAR